MQPFAVACAVVKPHDRQTALNQAVYRHNNQLLHLKICAEESDRRIGIRHQKQIDKGHHKRTEGVHDKRWQAKGKNTVDHLLFQMKTSVYKGYKQDKIEMRGDRAEMSDFPLYLNMVTGGLDCRDQAIGGFSFVVKIYAVPVVEIIG